MEQQWHCEGISRHQRGHLLMGVG